jgi:hypothetical protein
MSVPKKLVSRWAVFLNLDEVRLAQDEVGVVGLLDLDHDKLHRSILVSVRGSLAARYGVFYLNAEKLPQAQQGTARCAGEETGRHGYPDPKCAAYPPRTEETPGERDQGDRPLAGAVGIWPPRPSFPRPLLSPCYGDLLADPERQNAPFSARSSAHSTVGGATFTGWRSIPIAGDRE